MKQKIYMFVRKRGFKPLIFFLPRCSNRIPAPAASPWRQLPTRDLRRPEASGCAGSAYLGDKDRFPSQRQIGLKPSTLVGLAILTTGGNGITISKEPR
jgi:hypothetical protein